VILSRSSAPTARKVTTARVRRYDGGMLRWFRRWPALVFLLSVLASHDVAAQEPVASDSDRATAQVLFTEARDLMKDEKYAEACNKFRESQRLDPQIGTQLNLALCYEKLGKWASAWVNYVDAASRAQKAGQEERLKIAQDRATEIEG
jgi:Tfp pilus assembly protein PilF